MLEIIKTQYQSDKTLAKSNYYTFNTPEVNQSNGELYPLAMEYFHELNPGFLYKVPRPIFLQQFSAMTVRDGSASFGAFILKNHSSIPSFKTHFFIHPKLARIVPPSLASQFSCWNIVQPKKIDISQAQRVLIVCLMSEQIIPSLKNIKKQLQVLTQISPACEIDLFIPIRRNPFGFDWNESFIGYEVVEMIKELMPNKKLKFLSNNQLIERTDWRGVYCLDMMTEGLALTDSYLNHYIAARGGTVSSFNAQSAKDSVFEIDLNFNHKIEFIPLPAVDSLFPDMVFYKKQTASKDYMSDPTFHQLLREKDS